jgi:8-oxo-dGTP pyrophosphatase MutT (NUDIX family)
LVILSTAAGPSRQDHAQGWSEAITVTAFLARHRPVADGTAVWLDGTMRLHIASYLSGEVPPLAYVTSVRTVVLRGDAVLTLRNENGWHVLPGGRRIPGETLQETLCREVLEEAGWRIKRPLPIGFMHLRHLKPKPPGYQFLYPDFLWPVYVSEAASFDPRAKLADDYEAEAVFRPAASVGELGLSDDNRLYLDAALRTRGLVV